jgi:hypothetical protein
MPRKKTKTAKARTKKSTKPSTAKKSTKPSAAKAKESTASPRAFRGAAGAPGADGLPPAPFIILSEVDTKRRLKAIMGAQCGEDPANIRDESPIRRPNILLPRLLTAINQHFFPRPLNGIIGFPAEETVIECARRIKRTRDPQIPI